MSTVVVLRTLLALCLAGFVSVGAYGVARWSGEDRRKAAVWAACSYPVALGMLFAIIDQLRRN
ncbi:hypothetical protein ACIQOW_24605 [Kitasatospora sp. NPDC091335]|uniref:hypothetical protein n=1 Tax=Streptomycetaceae TaxID=2062 RepID=UPI001661A9B7|nr:hypothetical protein [Streptomyces sp. CBMA156]